MSTVCVVSTPSSVSTDVVNWLLEGSRFKPDESVLSFLKHLAGLKTAAQQPASSVIIIEAGAVATPDYKERLIKVIPKIPADYTTCLLSHYISSWDGIQHISGSEDVLCTITPNVHCSIAYWLRMSHIQYLLGIYDVPLRNVAAFDLSAETLSRTGKVCMLKTPLFAKLDSDNYRAYFAHYGFSSK